MKLNNQSTKEKQQVKQTDFLNSEEELHLIQRIKEGNAVAREKLILIHRPFVISKAEGIRKRLGKKGKRILLDDLINEGILGMNHAIKDFELKEGTRFLTYAGYWIEKYIKQELKGQINPVYIPSDKITLAREIKKAKDKLYMKLEREATSEEIAEYLELTVRQITGAYLPKRSSLESAVKVKGKKNKISLSKVLADKSSIEKELEKEEDKKELQSLLSRLTPKQSIVLKLNFGAEDKEALNLTEIAGELGISKERARQLRNSALKNTRQTVEGIISCTNSFLRS